MGVHKISGRPKDSTEYRTSDENFTQIQYEIRKCCHLMKYCLNGIQTVLNFELFDVTVLSGYSLRFRAQVQVTSDSQKLPVELYEEFFELQPPTFEFQRLSKTSEDELPVE